MAITKANIVNTINPADADLLGMLDSKKWNISSDSEIPWSAPTAASNYGGGYGFGETDGFSALSTKQKNAVRDILAIYALYLPITFTEITETDSVHAVLRFANTTTGTDPQASTYMPSSGLGGDTWFSGSGTDPDPGDVHWHMMVHEIGHGLGLKHPHEGANTVPSDKDWHAYAAASYRSYIGEGTGGSVPNETWGFTPTPMGLDIAALQHQYGVRASVNTGDTEYSWNATNGAFSINGVVQFTPGANRVFMLIPRDTAGVNTFDASNYSSGVTISLVAGTWSTLASGQLALLGSPSGVDKFPPGNFYIPDLYVSEVETINRVKLNSAAGNDTVTGNDEENTVALLGTDRSDWVFAGSGPYTLTSGDVVKTVSNIDNFEFDDDTYTLSEALGRVYTAFTLEPA